MISSEEPGFSKKPMPYNALERDNVPRKGPLYEPLEPSLSSPWVALSAPAGSSSRGSERRPRVCALRRLRFSRRAERNRASRARRAAILVGSFTAPRLRRSGTSRNRGRKNEAGLSAPPRRSGADPQAQPGSRVRPKNHSRKRTSGMWNTNWVKVKPTMSRAFSPRMPISGSIQNGLTRFGMASAAL